MKAYLLRVEELTAKIISHEHDNNVLSSDVSQLQKNIQEGEEVRLSLQREVSRLGSFNNDLKEERNSLTERNKETLK